MSLLTHRESQALQSFLSALDVGDGLTLPSDWPLLSSDIVPEDLVSQTEGTEALSKATKDLMALDHISTRPKTAPAVAAVVADNMTQGRNSPPISSPLHTTFPPNQRPSKPPLHSHKRPSTDSILSSQPSKRHRTSPKPTQNTSTTGTPGTASGSSSSSVLDPVPLPSKPTLLSPSQKKANHIQSEQKRRANIRRGYDALCDRVPELREAIRLEEEALTADPSLARRVAAEGSASGGKDKAKGRKKRGKGVTDDGEKIDGRAGPRSENIVLQKTIDYITALLSERQSLLKRLERARAVLPPTHPVLVSSTTTSLPLWEREWTGGTGLADPDGDGETDEDED